MIRGTSQACCAFTEMHRVIQDRNGRAKAEVSLESNPEQLQEQGPLLEDAASVDKPADDGTRSQVLNLHGFVNASLLFF